VHLQRPTAQVHCLGETIYTALCRHRIAAVSMLACSISLIRQDAQPFSKLVCSQIKSNCRHSIRSFRSSGDLHGVSRPDGGSAMVQSVMFKIS
jgi:hypothetical protein